ncbi:MAG TPA: hypothetical protein PKN32_03405 [Bacteroidales bacterium]|nr:hypothetical protein [Bacteroidales bacterium]
MKKVIIILLSFLFVSPLFSQNIDELAMIYAKQIAGEETLFTDKVIKNSEKEQWPILGNYYDEITFYYQWAIEYDYYPIMISEVNIQESREKTEYYIFDDQQVLKYYFLKYSDVEIVVKYNGSSAEFLNNTNIDLLDDWMYFIDTKTYFEFSSATERLNKLLNHLNVMRSYPNISLETDRVEMICKNINSDNSLVSKNIEGAIGYYKGKELVKIVWKQDRKIEYYFENGSLIFVSSDSNDYYKKTKVFFYKNRAFKVIIEGEDINRKDARFFESIFFIPMHIEELLWQFSN